MNENGKRRKETNQLVNKLKINWKIEFECLFGMLRGCNWYCVIF